ncbi:hypothetical protein BU23DRAFT_570278 [Bimuria novae-zelandiae CBS 107.79]|uniref:Uncharacterized protein n=1 Tax=Bimuria novae-zelandiae CBS 107.79 TaxID=1447943 RepID=A0A6A5V196_9PLEO|nr:hypothetical protein BU23DRAFT_570278 [Bimuria novae-zelandiae CBS 107.79]
MDNIAPQKQTSEFTWSYFLFLSMHLFCKVYSRHKSEVMTTGSENGTKWCPSVWSLIGDPLKSESDGTTAMNSPMPLVSLGVHENRTQDSKLRGEQMHISNEPLSENGKGLHTKSFQEGVLDSRGTYVNDGERSSAKNPECLANKVIGSSY